MSVAVSQTRLRASACAGQGPGAAPPAGQARLPGLRAVRQEHPATRADPSQDQCLRGAARAFAHEQGRRLARNDCKDQQNSPATSGGCGTAIISRGDCRERRGSSVTRPVRLHAPHSGKTPELTSVSQRLSRPLVRAVVLVLRGRIRFATCAAADIESRSPQVIRRRHYRMPRIVREVADPFPQLLKA